MKDLQPLETLLSSWKPRGPSARLERRIFARAGAPQSANPAAGTLTLWAAWLLDVRHAVATVAALVFLLCLVLTGSGWSNGSESGQGFPVLAAMSNQSWTVCLGPAQAGHNRLNRILGWTNGERFPSTNPSLDQLNTNYQLPRL
jgi:hypothetical protein